MTITAYYIKNKALSINRLESGARRMFNMLMHNNAKALQGLIDLG